MKRSLPFLLSKLKSLSVYSCVIAGLGFAGCQELAPSAENGTSDLSIPTDKTIIRNDISSLRTADSSNEVDKLMSKFAKVLAKSLQSEKFRGFLKSEASKKFDGDFDILFSKSKDVIIDRYSLSDLLIKSGELNSDELEALMRINKKLNISIPVNIEKWDTKSEAPIVIYIPSTYVENKTEFFSGNDYLGNDYRVDAIKEPTVPVIVIGRNERAGYNDIKSKEVNARTSGNYERIEYIKCPNLNDIEGWANGAPEIRFDGVIYSIAGGTAMTACSNTEYVPSRHHAKDGYTLAAWTATQNLFRWYFNSGHGPNYYLQTFEVDDSGSTQTTNVGVTYNGITSSIGLSYKEDDKKMKGELIYTTHPSPATIADGNIQFRLEN
ncbi:hypothetical protein MUK70_19060 [Dyadobacter chenwenxiniae]|uniref:DUF4848 domain-containing protein n=1 Tax=Dyadobacter chenwenxiniae TaxID=2906456 RepID=A0A9X1PMU2_9BACT|nr:hypothetical protein [Dyadobacter chenwenxiniae]MCF0061341.1 hypothetical protein [Dyadobacter chenwenxiniae]UON81163.1 hypothetical protein MUK70_19060 [Dyadobacter chenwenxiniae]